MAISVFGNKNFSLTNETKHEKKTFKSLEELKVYLQESGFNEKEIRDLEQKWMNGDNNINFNKTSSKIDLTFNRDTFTSKLVCTRCHKPLQQEDNNCRYCGTPIKIPFWKKILGLR